MDNLDVMQLALNEATKGWHRKNARGSILDEENHSIAFNGRGGSDKGWVDQGEANVTHILNCSPENMQVFLDIIKEQDAVLSEALRARDSTEIIEGLRARVKKWVEQLKVSCPAKSGGGHA